MIKFHRPRFVIAPPDTPSAERNLIQEIFHKKKDDISPAERKAVQMYADRSSRTKLFGGLVTFEREKAERRLLTEFSVERLRDLAGQMRALDAKAIEDDQANEAERIEVMQRREDGSGGTQSLLDRILESDDESSDVDTEVDQVEQSDATRISPGSQSDIKHEPRKYKSAADEVAETALRFRAIAAKEEEKTNELTESSLFTRAQQDGSFAIASREVGNKIVIDGKKWEKILHDQKSERAQVANEIVDIFSTAAKKGIDLSTELNPGEIINLTRSMGLARAPNSLRVAHDGVIKREHKGEPILDDEGNTIPCGSYKGSFKPLKKLARQNANLLHPSQVLALVTRMDDAANVLGKSVGNKETKSLVPAQPSVANLEEALAKLSHIDPKELSRLVQPPGQKGSLAKNRILQSLDTLNAGIWNLLATVRKSPDLQQSGDLPAPDKRQLMQANKLLAHIQTRWAHLYDAVEPIGFVTSMDDSAKMLDLLARNGGVQSSVSAEPLRKNLRKVLATLEHIDTQELSRLVQQPGNEGGLAKSRILLSLNALNVITWDLLAKVRKALDPEQSGDLQAPDKRRLMQAKKLLERVQTRWVHLHDTIAPTTLADMLNIQSPPRTPKYENGASGSSETEAVPSDELSWPLRLPIKRKDEKQAAFHRILAAIRQSIK